MEKVNAMFNSMACQRNTRNIMLKKDVLSIVDLDEEEKEHDHVAEECKNIENKKSNAQLKPQ